MLRPGDTLADRYRLDDLLSESGSGRFWRAHDQVLQRPVALHVIAAADERAAGLLDAARRSAAVINPRILRVLDAQQRSDVCFVVNEWSAGTSLDIALASNGPLIPRRAVWLVAEVADSVAVAHAHGVHHGRLVPENVLIDGSGNLRIIGFSVDAALHGLPPGDEVGDVRDLAGLLYAALSGRWAGESSSAVPPAPQEGGHVLRPRQVRAGVPRPLDDLADQLLNPDSGRARSVRDLGHAAAVASYLSDFVGDPAGIAESLAVANPTRAPEPVVLEQVPDFALQPPPPAPVAAGETPAGLFSDEDPPACDTDPETARDAEPASDSDIGSRGAIRTADRDGDGDGDGDGDAIRAADGGRDGDGSEPPKPRSRKARTQHSRRLQAAARALASGASPSLGRSGALALAPDREAEVADAPAALEVAPEPAELTEATEATEEMLDDDRVEEDAVDDVAVEPEAAAAAVIEVDPELEPEEPTADVAAVVVQPRAELEPEEPTAAAAVIQVEVAFEPEPEAVVEPEDESGVPRPGSRDVAKAATRAARTDSVDPIGTRIDYFTSLFAGQPAAVQDTGRTRPTESSDAGRDSPGRRPAPGDRAAIEGEDWSTDDPWPEAATEAGADAEPEASNAPADELDRDDADGAAELAAPDLAAPDLADDPADDPADDLADVADADPADNAADDVSDRLDLDAEVRDDQRTVEGWDEPLPGPTAYSADDLAAFDRGDTVERMPAVASRPRPERAFLDALAEEDARATIVAPRRGLSDVPTWLRVTLIVALVLILMLALALTARGGSDEPAPATRPVPTGDGGPVLTGLSAALFDPSGNPGSAGDGVGSTVDDDLGTSWTTGTFTEQFSPQGARAGLGVVVDTGTLQAITRVDLTFEGSPSHVAVYVTSQRPQSAGTLRSIGDFDAGVQESLDMPDGTTGRYVVVYLTKLPQVGANYEGGIADITVHG